MAGKHLEDAKKAKNDEFYTQLSDIEQEVCAYLDYTPDLFRDKTVLLPCDNPETSNFTKFFVSHFVDFGLKKLVSTSYAHPKYIGDGPRNGRIMELSRDDFAGGDGIDPENLEWRYLDGDGDFRSDEVTRLRDRADFVITNPPFSLFREFLAWLMKADDIRFSMIGSINAISYKGTNPLIKDGLLWLGATANTRDMVFAVPKGSSVNKSERARAERLGHETDERYDYRRLGNTCWFTNIEHRIRNTPLPLNTMAENLANNGKLIKRLNGSDQYRHYDNIDGIDVPFTDAIPSDYDGLMGVPISFFNKYNPKQFEIVGFRYGDDGKELRVDGVRTYIRAIIRHR